MVRAAGSSLTCGLGPYGTPNKAHTNPVPVQYSLYIDEQQALAFYTKCGTPVGGLGAVSLKSGTLDAFLHWTV